MITEDKACNGKKRFDSLVQAERFMRAMIWADRKGFSGPMRAYQCQFCGAYHFGHVPQRHVA